MTKRAYVSKALGVSERTIYRKIREWQQEDRQKMRNRNGTRCSFSDAPLEGCYILSMNSKDVEKILRYCGGNFEECDIYRKHVQASEKTESLGNGDL